MRRVPAKIKLKFSEKKTTSEENGKATWLHASLTCRFQREVCANEKKFSPQNVLRAK